MKKQSNDLWCIEYDEESYEQNFKKINFTKYLKRILSSQYFAYFQKQISIQLQDPDNWNRRSWGVIKFFQYLNKAFSYQSMQSNMVFVPQSNLRKAFGTFQMWIDLERLYLFSFLTLDRIQFQEDRIYFTFYRTIMFLKAFLSEHQVTDFNEGFLSDISKNIKNHTKVLLINVPSYMHPILGDIENITDNFINQKILLPEINEINFKKIVYSKLQKLRQMVEQIQKRLITVISHQDGFRKQNNIRRLTNQGVVNKITQDLEYLYDQNVFYLKQMKEKAIKNGQQFDEQKIKEYWQQLKKKQNEKYMSQNPYQSLMKANHNPYQQSNFVIFGQILGIDMNKKKLLQQSQEQQVIQQEIQINTSDFYSQQLLKKVTDLDKIYGQVVQQDLKLNMKSIKKNNLIDKNQAKLSNLKWQKSGYPSKQYLQTAEKSKDITNNIIIKQNEDNQLHKKIQSIQILKRGGLQSNALYELQKKSQKYYKKLDNELMINLKQNCIEERNQFDNLRKVTMLSATQKKIHNLLQSHQVPQFYRRNLQQIRQFPSNPQIKSSKIQIALSQI